LLRISVRKGPLEAAINGTDPSTLNPSRLQGDETKKLRPEAGFLVSAMMTFGQVIPLPLASDVVQEQRTRSADGPFSA
jgi:hypothetical protein